MEKWKTIHPTPGAYNIWNNETIKYLILEDYFI